MILQRMMFWRKKAREQKPAPEPEKTQERLSTPTNSSIYGGMGVLEMKLRMELIVDQKISSAKDMLMPAKQLAEHAKADQDRFLESAEKLSATSVGLAYDFCRLGPPSLQLVDEAHWDGWLVRLQEIHAADGAQAAAGAMNNVEQFVQSITHAPSSVSLDKISRILESFVTGLNGRKLGIEQGASFYTDTEIIRLPELLTEFDRYEDNFALYKAMAVHQWAQAWFGTWTLNIGAFLGMYQDPERAQALFHKLETIRLDACIERELPGISRVMKDFSPQMDAGALSKNWQNAVRRLQEADMTVQDTIFFLEAVYKDKAAPEDKPYQGSLNPGEAWTVREARVQREKRSLENRLIDLQRELEKYSDDVPDEEQGRHKAGFTVEEIEGEAPADGRKIELQYGGNPIEVPENLQQLLESITQDLGNIPDDYLQTEVQDPNQDEALSGPPPQAASSQDSETTWLYDEWDHSRQKYRKEWCRLKELEVEPVHDGFVPRTLDKHRGLLKHLHRTFESLREDDRRIKRQPYGDDVDLDAVIEAFSDTRIGLEASQNLFTRSRKVDRNIAVMFMIDMSGSTAGWVNEMEREALVLLCESLEILGDRYSIYGFSGFTHERCELYRIKEFEEPYSDLVKARISGIQAQGYTRMGAAVRHLTKLLHQVEARTKLLIALSDGRPDDQDGYRGPYGIEDTRRALIEAKYLGIHPFCITIDEEAMDYLQHMYGPASFTVVDDVDKLPYRVSDIYRRIAF